MHQYILVCLLTCITFAVTAEEITNTTEPTQTTTPQPPIVDSPIQPVYGPDTTNSTSKPEPVSTNTPLPPTVDKSDSLAVTAEEITNPTEPTQTATPQPPIVDSPIQPVYEPDTTNSTSKPEPVSTNTTLPPTVDKSDSLNDESNEPKDESTDEPDDNAGEQIPPPIIKVTTEETTEWSNTRPNKVNADWLQLTSGEWLRGKIIIMQKDNLEFDSDELDEIEIEWKKVKYIKSYEPYSLRFDGRKRAVGAIEITQDKIHIATDYDDQTFNRNELLSIATGKETEISKWKNKITFSFNVRRGNTDQTDFTSKISAKRRTVNSRLLLDYLGNFTEVEATKTINNHRMNATFDIFITRNLFLTPIAAEFFRDPFQNLEKRFNVGVAIGYTIINTNKTEWDISGGPAYQATTFVSVQAGEDSKDNTTTLVLSTKFDTEVNSKVDLEGLYSVTLGDAKTGGYTHHSVLTVETEITNKLDFDVSAVWDRVKRPVPGEDGKTPQENDFRILIGLGYDL